MTSLTLTTPAVSLPVVPLRSWLVAAVQALLTWRERARGRRLLAGLDDHLLRDIGLDRASAAHEAGKGFWQP